MDNYIRNVLHHSSFSCHLIKKIYRRSGDVRARIGRRCRGRGSPRAAGRRDRTAVRLIRGALPAAPFGLPEQIPPCLRGPSSVPSRHTSWQSRNRDSGLNRNPPSLHLPTPTDPRRQGRSSPSLSRARAGFAPRGASTRCFPGPVPTPSALPAWPRFVLPGRRRSRQRRRPPSRGAGPCRDTLPTPSRRHGSRPGTTALVTGAPRQGATRPRVRTALWREKWGKEGSSIHTGQLLARSRVPAPGPVCHLHTWNFVAVLFHRGDFNPGMSYIEAESVPGADVPMNVFLERAPAGNLLHSSRSRSNGSDVHVAFN